MTRAALILASLLVLSACTSGPSLVMTGIGVATFIHTEKTLVDHAVSHATEKDCATLHTVKNEPYCQSPPTDPRQRRADMSGSLHCYRTLGTVTCYTRRDPSASQQTRIDYVHGYAPAGSDATLDNGVPAEMAAPVAALPGNAAN